MDPFPSPASDDEASPATSRTLGIVALAVALLTWGVIALALISGQAKELKAVLGIALPLSLVASVLGAASRKTSAGKGALLLAGLALATLVGLYMWLLTW